MLDIPEDRKRISTGKLCLLIAVAVMLYMTVTAGFAGTVHGAIASTLQ
jgi:hypothetical protein